MLRRPDLPAAFVGLASMLAVGFALVSCRADEPLDEISNRLDRLVPAVMDEHHTPGVAIALIRDRRIAWQRAYGVREAGTGEPVDDKTVFEAASMSKPLFALAVMRLVEEERIDLDRPLVEYLDAEYLPEEPLHRKITARMVLQHTAGFPNWRPGGRRGGGPLPVRFEPGTRFGYSGEGFWYLQHVVEELVGEPTSSWIERTVLSPLGMDDSSFAWRDDYTTVAAAGHDAEGKVRTAGARHRVANAAFTLFTNPGDYSRFLVAMMPGPQRSVVPGFPRSAPSPRLPSPASIEAMLVPAVQTDDPDIWRGLGWAIDTSAERPIAFHSGSNRTGFRACCRFDPASGRGIVIMTNAVGGRQVWQQIIEAIW